MGFWAFELFKNDTDQDMVIDMANEAGVDSILHTNDSTSVRNTLNNGILKSMLSKRKAPGFQSKYLFDLCRASNAEHEFCILAAAAMTVGATIDAEDMAYIHKVYKKAELLKEGEAQMEVALKEYKNDGTPWVFKPVLPQEESDDDDNVAPGGFKLMNKFPPGSFMDQYRKNSEMQAKMREAMRSAGWTGPRPNPPAQSTSTAAGGDSGFPYAAKVQRNQVNMVFWTTH